jgi:hypothetical protein
VRFLVACGLAACSFRDGAPVNPARGDAALSDVARADAAADAMSAVGSLAVTRQLVTGPFDLTTEGTLDWAAWGATTVNDFDHKANGGGKIATWTKIGTATVYGYGNAYNSPGNDGFTWSDGTPVGNQPTAQYSGVWINGAPNGFSTTVPAGSAMRTLRMYVGAYNATGTFTAHLSDSSAPDYVDVAGIGNASSSWAGVYEVTYRSVAQSATLAVTWVQSSAGGGDVNWSAASLR